MSVRLYILKSTYFCVGSNEGSVEGVNDGWNVGLNVGVVEGLAKVKHVQPPLQLQVAASWQYIVAEFELEPELEHVPPL